MWHESASEHFVARHDDADANGAVAVLRLLEDTRARLGERFRSLPEEEIAVVLHGAPAQLHAAVPLLAVRSRLLAPAFRRYAVGRLSGSTIHVLAPRALDARATRVDGSRELLRLAPAALYAELVAEHANPRLRGVRGARWTWLRVGAADFFGGRIRHTRAVVARRLREGSPPSLPPSPRDAPLLAGTLLELLAREEGEEAAVRLVRDAGSDGGPTDALRRAFRGRPLHHTERTWLAHLTRDGGADRGR